MRCLAFILMLGLTIGSGIRCQSAATRLDSVDPLGFAPTASPEEKAECLYRLGLRYYENRSYQLAAQRVRLAILLDPEHEEAVKLLAEVSLKLAEGKEAASQTEETAGSTEDGRLRLTNTAFSEAVKQYNDGLDHAEEGKYGAAKECFERCIEVIRWFPHSFFGLEDLCMEAIKECDRRLRNK